MACKNLPGWDSPVMAPGDSENQSDGGSALTSTVSSGHL